MSSFYQRRRTHNDYIKRVPSYSSNVKKTSSLVIMRPSILRSASLIRGDIYHRLWQPVYHVAPANRITNEGCFHSRSFFKAGGTTSKRLEVGTSIEFTNGWLNKIFLITSSAPSITKYQDVLDQLSTLMRTSSVDFREKKNTGIVILATPTFATWLENNNFMRIVLETIFRDTPGNARAPTLDVTALMAIVDGLPSTGYNDMDKITEGFAFLLCDPQTVLPDLWRNENNATHDQPNYAKSSITFRLHPSSGAGTCLDIGIPLANTMFRNGRTSTLLASKWNRTDTTYAFERVKQVDKISATVYPTTSGSIIPLHFEIPLVPLTPPRRVVSGLGNILRQVANEDGRVVSASQELEASIDSYLESRLLNKQNVTVWALIIPNATVMDGIGNNTIVSNPEQIRASWTDNVKSSMESYVGNLIQKGSGATLHRVLSGGGGWGPKQGLLSLDPETMLPYAEEKGYVSTLGNSADNDQIQALGNIAKPGSWVQFLILDNFMLNRTTVNADAATVKPGIELAGNISFGCIASTVDNIPPPSSDPSALGHANEPRYSVDSFNGRFGATSEAGIFILASQNDAATSLKVDVPNSNIHLALVEKKR